MDRLAGCLRERAGCLELEWREQCAPLRSGGAGGREAVVIGPAGRRDDALARALIARPDEPGEALSALRPMGGGFAFALWDPGRSLLSLGCDPLGLQALYYAEEEDGLRFGTRLGDIPAPGEVKLQLAACEHFLRFLSVPADRSLLGGVRKIPPGEWRFFPDNPDGTSVLHPIATERPAGRAAAAGRLTEALRAAVASATEGAAEGAPIGVLLSGGLDSTALLALLREAWPGPIVALHASAAGSPDRRYAREMAERFGAEFLEASLTGEDARDSLAWIVASMEAPGGNASAVANCRAFALARERGVARVLSGLGSDEVFCGHTKHLLAPWWPWAHRVPLGWRKALAARLPRRAGPGLRFALEADGGPAEMHRAMYALLSPAECDQMRGGLAVFAQAAALPWRSPEEAGFPPGYAPEVLQVDLNQWLRSSLTPMAGALAAANDIELALPFCTPELIRLSAALPLSWKVRAGAGKRILRRALRGTVPHEIFRRPRHGFTVPMAEWLREELAPMAKELLAPRRVERWCLLDPSGPGRMLREHLEGKADRSLPVWAWMTFSLWFDRFVENRGQP